MNYRGNYGDRYSVGTKGYYDKAYEQKKKRAEILKNLRPEIEASKPARIIQNPLPPDLEGEVVRSLKTSMSNNFLASSFMQKQGVENLTIDGFNHWYSEKKQYNINSDKYWWHHILTKVDNHLLQYATNHKAAYSYIASKHIITMLEKLHKEFGNDMEKHMDKFNEQCGDNGKNPSTEEDSEAYKEFKNKLEKGTTRANNKIKKDIKETAAKGSDSLNGAGKGAIEQIKLFDSPIIKKLDNINKGSLKAFFKTTIDKATQNAIGQQSLIEESFFDSEEIEELSNIENFAHIALFEDLVTRCIQYHVSFDIYIDDSGSMSGKNFIDNVLVSYRDLAHLVAFRLNQLKLLRDCYLFASHHQLAKIPIEELFKTVYGGGTNIDQCFINAKKVNRPCIIITDGSDTLNPKNYFRDAFILTLEVSSLNKSFVPYAENGQLLGYRQGKMEKYIVNGVDEYGRKGYLTLPK